MECSIIIVNYNTADLVKCCIDSLLKQTGIEFEIIVVDNASRDHSLENLSRYGSKIHVIANSENAGFSIANNQGAAQSQGRYLFLLNPDAVMQSPSDLRHLVNTMIQHPHYGLAGTRILTKNRESLPCTDYPGQKYLKIDFSHLPGKIAWVLGASMIIRRDVFEQVKGFDEAYFLYGDEVDLCFRIRKQGYSIGYIPEITIEHVGGASEKPSSVEQTWRRKQIGLHQFISQYYPRESVIKLVKRDWRRARYRVLWLQLQQCFCSLNQKKLAKLQRYKTICVTSQEFLNQ